MTHPTPFPVLYPGDCRQVMVDLLLDGRTVDAVVTDPPYDLVSIVERFGAPDAAPAKGGVYHRTARGFMGHRWDGTGVAFDPATWRPAFALLKPGGHLLAFGGTRTFHRLASALEAAGFEIRDTIAWLYGSGFPKSHSLAPGVGTALKPAMELITVARRPLEARTLAENHARHGCGGLNIDECRVPLASGDWLEKGLPGVYPRGSGSAWAMSRVDRPPGLGRWPANVAHDGSDDVLDAFAAFGVSKSRPGINRASARPRSKAKGADKAWISEIPYSDEGTPARFFYSAKAGAVDRAGSEHPTVKPLALMRWLVALVTPPGGTVLDPFAGSGTTLQAAYEVGRAAIGCERESSYCDDIRRRLFLL